MPAETKPNSRNAYDDKNSSQTRNAPTGSNKKFSIEAPVVSLPKGGGAIKSIDEKFTVNAVNGTASFSLPIPIASARGFSPATSLSYDSGNGNGIFGLGWSIGVISIKRKTEKKLPTYFDEENADVFILSGAEDLVPEFKKDNNGNFIKDENGNFLINEFDSSDTKFTIRRYKPRIEGAFSRIERWKEKATGIFHWRIISGSNVTTILGKSPEARITNPKDALQTFEWFAELTYDDKGNCAVYKYKAEDAAGMDVSKFHNKNRKNGNAAFTNTYLKRILHGNISPYLDPSAEPPVQFMFETVFDYGEHDTAAPPFNEIDQWVFRIDAFSTYKPRFEIRTCRLCKRILLYHHFEELPGGSALVKSMNLSYDNNGLDGFNFLTAIILTGYTKHDDGTYTEKSFPPFTFEYQKHEWNTEIKSVDPKNLFQSPYGIDENKYQFVDLFNEGLSGILTEQADGWFYKHNLGSGNFEKAQLVSPKPSFKGLSSGLQILDLESNGEKQIVQFSNRDKGFFELNDDNSWQSFRSFSQLPNIDFNDHNLKFIDLNGDGSADLLISEDDIFIWYASEGKNGFAIAQTIFKGLDEEKNPSIVFDDGTQTVFLADMNGDGLTDIARIRNGEVCYWTNMGYGKFGAKISMDNAPYFDHADTFDPSLIRLADLDGSGTADIVYLGKDHFTFWLNKQGNSFSSEPFVIDPFPEINNAVHIGVIDLLGTGVACITWNSPQEKDAGSPLRYIDFFDSKKPHVLTSYKNNLGKEIYLEYKPSTQYYIQDKLAGTPWVTKLHFPVQCVSKITAYDRIIKTRFATEYSYHHGYYDHEEKEFRGFGRVDQKDAEDITHFILQNGNANNIIEEDLHQPPVLSKTWFHLGASLNNKKILDQFAHEYFQNNVVAENILPEPVLPDDLNEYEWREALRTCKGMLLRKEVYALDGTESEAKPYAAEQHNCLIKMLQPKNTNENAVFFVHESEAISYHYERNEADPRIAHNFILAIDDFGNVLQSASVVYPRKIVSDEAEQNKLNITLEENKFTNGIQQEFNYRAPSIEFIKSYELTGLAAPVKYFVIDQIQSAFTNAAVIDYEVEPTNGLQKRLIEFVRTQYRGNNGTAILPFGTIESKALPHQSFKAAFNNNILNKVFNTKISLNDLTSALTNTSKGGYIFQDGYFWIPSGTVNYDTSHFFLSTQYTDAFGKITNVEYGPNYFLFVKKTTDTLQNVTEVVQFNYRTLSALLMKDINDNLAAVRFDELGMVVKTFVIGKKGIDKGDVFDDTKSEMKNADDHPTTELEYDLSRWYDQTRALNFDINNYKPQPSFVKTTVRETHYLTNEQHNSLFQQSYTYSDGSGHEVLRKVQSEPGLALQVNNDGTVSEVNTTPNVRWVGNGRTVINNKGNAVKQYEPYFSASFDFDDEKEMVELGVTSVMHYDPLNRVIRTDLPNKTFSKVEFTPWQQVSYDANDTATDSGWYIDLGSPDPSGAEPADADKRAAWLAAKHYNTPTIAHLDTLGRTFLTVEDDLAEKISTRIKFDIEGNQLEIRDGLDHIVMTYKYGMIGNKLFQQNMEAGRRWTITDVAAKPLLSWDDRDHAFSFEYDDLRRPLQSLVKTGNANAIVFDKTEYGETQANAKTNNLRGKAFRHYDQSSVVTNIAYDFKNNLLNGSRQLVADHQNQINWSNIPSVVLDTEMFSGSTEYDALNRPIKIITPHSATMPANEIYPKYNEANLLNAIEVIVRGATNRTVFISDINYNAKGQRTEIFYGNNTTTKYRYDEETFRLTRLLTTRNTGADILQDLNYTFDPVGNITQIKDNAQPDVFFDNEQAQALNKFEYDAIYRLTKATGRKHAGQTDIDNTKRSDLNYRNFPFLNSGAINPNDANAFRNYTEQYSYDKANNMLGQQHTSKNSNFTRTFNYANTNNQLTKTTVGAFNFSYTYDAHGNMELMEQLNEMTWDFMDHLKELDLGGGGHAYYVYDSKGQRVRKVIERPDGKKLERIYLGVVEIYRERDNANTITLERETLHVLDDQKRIAMVDTPVIKPNDNTETQLIRYQYSNHLGSASLELDNGAQLISYEEYFPFGTTSYSLTDTSREISAKRYRYTGKERDEESGLNYHGARYCAAWLCRWISADPAGLIDGNNLYRYARNNPVKLNDPNGMEPNDDKLKKPQVTPLLEQQTTTTRTDTTLAGRYNTGYIFRYQPLQLTLTGGFHSQYDANINRTEGNVNLSTRSLLTVGTVGEGLYAGLYFKGNLTLPVSNNFQLGQLPDTLLSSQVLEGRGQGIFLGNLSAGSFNLATLQGNVSLADRQLRLNFDADSIGSLAQVRFRSTTYFLQSGGANIDAQLRLKTFGLPLVGLDATGQLRPGGGDATNISAQGRLHLFGIPSLRLNATGTVTSTGAYDFNVSAYGYVPPLSYVSGSATLSSTQGISARANVFGLTYTPGIDIKDPAPLPAIVRQQYNLPADPSVPNGLTLGFSHFSYSQGNFSYFSVGYIPDFSNLGNPRFGFTAQGHF